MIWENPTDITDGVARSHMDKNLHKNYNKEAIMEAANRYFKKVEYFGNALHVDTRHVYKMSM